MKGLAALLVDQGGARIAAQARARAMTAVDGLPASTAPSVPEVPDNLLAAPLVDLQPWEKLTGEPREFADDLEDLVS